MKKYNVEDLTAEVLLEMAREVNGWDGSLDRFDYWVNDQEFFDTFYTGRPMEAVQAAYYGDYQYHDDYVRMDGAENLVSAAEWALEAELLEAAEEIAGIYTDLVNNGSIEDYAGILVEIEEEAEIE